MLTKAIIFDLEGVIIDTQQFWTKTTRAVVEARGKVYDRARLLPLMAGCSLPQGTAVLKREAELEDPLEALIEERLTRMKQELAKGTEFIDGFREFFEAIREQRQHAIATSMTRHLLGPASESLGLHQLFGGHLYDVSMVGDRGKPAPDLFLLAAERLGVDPAECTVIEDAPNGIEAARCAGMRSIGIATTFGREKLASAELVIESFDEIPLAETI